MTKKQITRLYSKALVSDQTGKILVIRRSETHPEKAGLWDLVGGCIEFGENPIAALVREAQEEIGQPITPLGLLEVHSALVPKKHKDIHAVGFIYKAHLTGPPAEIRLSSEHDAYRWLTEYADLEEVGLAHKYHRWVAARLLRGAVLS